MKKILTVSFSILISLLLLCSCFEKSFLSCSFFAMDTFITLQARTSDRNALSAVQKLVLEDEKMLSRTIPDSEIYSLNKNGKASLSDECLFIVKEALEFSKNTDGAFSPLMGGLADLWDIKSENPRVPSEKEILRELSKCNLSSVSFEGNDIEIKSGAKLDLGGIAKGYSAERVISSLRDFGITDALVGFGGSIACIGSPENDKLWKIGIKNPFDTDDILGTVEVTDCYIAVSGAYERYFEKDGTVYHHILNPKNGYPANSDIASTVVISNSGICADALSTALFVMGSDKALELYRDGQYNFEAILIMKDGTVLATKGLSDVFEFNKNAVYTVTDNGEEKLRYTN